MPSDFQSNKLIRGAGPMCMQVLDSLATQAIKISKVNTVFKMFMAAELHSGIG